MTRATPIEFGLKIPDVEYIERPSAYGVIFDEQGHVLVVNTPGGMHLPGGGAEEGESPEQNLLRELMEECGLRTNSYNFVTSATQYLHAVGEGYFAKRCDYFLVEVMGLGESSEDDHEVCWIDPGEALSRLHHESHQHGLRVALEDR